MANLLRNTEGTLLGGQKLCYMDFYLFELIQLAEMITRGEILDNYPWLQDYKYLIANLPNLREHLESNPKT